MRALLCLALVACVDTHVDAPDLVGQLCAYIAECAPVQTRGVDWSRVDECAAAIVDVYACAEAWEGVQCIPEGATLEDVMASTPGIQAAMQGCL